MLSLLLLYVAASAGSVQDWYFKEDHVTGAFYFRLAANGTYTLTAREHMGLWELESGRWQLAGETITFVGHKPSKKSYQAAVIDHKAHRFLTFKSEGAAGPVIPPEDTRRQLDAEPGALPLDVFFEIEKNTYVRETNETYPFRTRRLKVTRTVAPVQSARRTDRIVGLLTLPEVFGQESCEKFVPTEVALYLAPESERVGSIRVKEKEGTPPECWLPVTVQRQGDPRINRLPTREYDYEAPAAIVLEQRDRWFRVQLSQGSAWVRASARDEYLSLEKLLMKGLTYLTGASDGRLSAAAGAAPLTERARIPAERPVRVQAFQRVRNQLWIQIQVMTHSICSESREEPKVEAEGWIPAHGTTGEPTIWFYSRGC